MKNIKPFFKRVVMASAILCLAGYHVCKAQESAAKEEKEEFSPHSQLALVISHVHVSEGRDESGDKQNLNLPAWGLDYTYVFHPKWAVGLHTDFIIEKFKVEKEVEGGAPSDVIERSYPIAPALMGIYKPNNHWSLMLGLGEEFAKEENYTLTRGGIEYSAEVPGGWEVFGTLSYDFKWNAYDSWGTGIGIAKVFGKHHK